ncbi:MAG: phage tail protein [Clostridia bacterium]|nr:phage tail protein [Clostridia bacterium]
MTEYVTIQGDTWDLISFKVFGNERYMLNLIEANPQYHNIVVFPANIKLIIPEIQIPISNRLPPWKRGG